MIPSSDKQKRALGRGLSALIPQGQPPPSIHAAAAPMSTRGLMHLPIESIERDPDQPRKEFDSARLAELAESIRTQGLIQPILVRRNGDGYRIIAGERRWRAAQLVGLKEIPALVRDVSEAEAFELALVENLQRTDLNPIEEAEGYQRLLNEFGLTQERVSERVGKDRSSVANALRLLGLPADVRGLVSAGALSAGHAKALLAVKEAGELSRLAQRVVEQRLSVRETERLAQGTKAAAAAPAAPKESPQTRALVEELQRSLGTKVRLDDKGGRGTLQIEYFTYDDLDRILAVLRK